MAFFTSIALKATQGEKPYKYLSVILNDGETRDYLGYSADEVVNPNAKFAVEYAHGDLVHIRSCRTNKYWVRSSSDGYWIVAKASKPLDDQSSWNCTLFRMDYNSDDNKATFYHVQSETVVCLRNDGSDRKMFLCIDLHTTTDEAISTVVDLNTFQLLPKYIALKADNGKLFEYSSTMGFTSDDYDKDTVANEILTNRDGYIRIRKKGAPEDDGCWTCLDDIIETSIFPRPEDDPSTLFEVVRVKDGLVALRNLVYGYFCRRGWYDNSNVLSASATSIIKEAQFQVVETVLSRDVQVHDFDLDNSRIYNLTTISSDTQTYDNPTGEKQVASMNLQISTKKTSTWKNSFSVSSGIETTFTTGIPFIAEGQIKVSAAATYAHEFGETTEETHQIGGTYTVIVPPFTRAKVTATVTKGTCDVPVTYSQVDRLTDGSTIRTTLSDGVFTGDNAYDFRYHVDYENIPHELKLKFSQLTTSTD